MDDTIIQEVMSYECKACGKSIAKYGICQDCIEAYINGNNIANSDGNG